MVFSPDSTSPEGNSASFSDIIAALNRVYELRWEKGDLAGLEIDIRKTTVDVVEQLRAAVGNDEFAALLAAHVITWNYEDAGGNIVPLEASEILANLEREELVAIGSAWYTAAVGVTAPLDLGSTSGEPFPEELIIETVPL